MAMKHCSKCFESKDLSEFATRNDVKCGYRAECKKCVNEQKKQYYQNNEMMKENMKQYYLSNIDIIKEKKKKYYHDHFEMFKEQKKHYYENNRDKINEYKRNKHCNDEKYRLACNLRNRVRDALNRNHRSSNTFNLIGCSKEFLYYWLISHLNDFEKLKDKHVDHVRACSTFDLRDPLQQRECFCWRNLQMLSPEENIRKRINATSS